MGWVKWNVNYLGSQNGLSEVKCQLPGVTEWVEWSKISITWVTEWVEWSEMSITWVTDWVEWSEMSITWGHRMGWVKWNVNYLGSQNGLSEVKCQLPGVTEWVEWSEMSITWGHRMGWVKWNVNYLGSQNGLSEVKCQLPGVTEWVEWSEMSITWGRRMGWVKWNVKLKFVLFNDATGTHWFLSYHRLLDVIHMVALTHFLEGNPLPPHRLLFLISSKGSFICTFP